MARTPRSKKLGLEPSEEPKPEKRPMGRPTKYKPECCERVLELAKDGCGWADYAAEFGIDRTTLYQWADSHPEFLTALSRAKVLEQQWWERAGRSGMFAEKFNALVWKTSVQARFRGDYTERMQTELTGKDGGPVKVEAKTIDTKQMTPEQREAFRQFLMAAKGD